MNVIIYSDIGEQIILGTATTANEAYALALANGFTASSASSDLMDNHSAIESDGQDRVWIVAA